MGAIRWQVAIRPSVFALYRPVFDPYSTRFRPIFDPYSTHIRPVFDPYSTRFRPVFDPRRPPWSLPHPPPPLPLASPSPTSVCGPARPLRPFRGRRRGARAHARKGIHPQGREASQHLAGLGAGAGVLLCGRRPLAPIAPLHLPDTIVQMCCVVPTRAQV